MKLPDIIFFFGRLDYHLLFYRNTTFWEQVLFLFSGKEATNLMYPLHEAILSQWAT